MNRTEMIDRIESRNQVWDIVIIGGGATGAGCAIEASALGYRTLLLEKYDFGKGTSSRSTKLIHGGVRYLQQGNVKLVLETLHERGLLLQNAPHIVSKCPFVIPNYKWWEFSLYGAGLTLYDILSGKYSFGHSRILSRKKVIDMIPNIETSGLKSGVLYYDGQFDEARLIINMAETAVKNKAVILNYFEVKELIKSNNKIDTVIALDHETGRQYRIKAKIIINATGVFVDRIRQMEDPDANKMISASQGAHIVLNRSFLPGDAALMVPKTEDGRVLFAIPWQGYLVVGTTDTPVNNIEIEPRPFDYEIEFILKHARKYLEKDPCENDILSMFAGLRPLVSIKSESKTKDISREHFIQVSDGGLLTITGGKWTTYRKMAEDTIKQAAKIAGLPYIKSITKDQRIHAYHQDAGKFGRLSLYGADAPELKRLIDSNPLYKDDLHKNLSIQAGEVIWAVRKEMALKVEDFLARRRRTLFQDARSAIEAAPKVASLMAKELNKDSAWEQGQLKEFKKIAENFLPGNGS